MKSLITFLTDSILITGFLVLAGGAFFATFALSPIRFEDSIFAETNQTNVAGVKDSGVYFEEVINAEYPDNVGLRSTREENSYRSIIQFDSIQKGETRFPIVRLINSSKDLETLKFRVKSPQNVGKNIEWNLVIDNQEYRLDPTNLTKIAFTPNYSQTIELQTTADTGINYVFDAELIIDL